MWHRSKLDALKKTKIETSPVRKHFRYDVCIRRKLIKCLYCQFALPTTNDSLSHDFEAHLWSRFISWEIEYDKVGFGHIHDEQALSTRRRALEETYRHLQRYVSSSAQMRAKFAQGSGYMAWASFSMLVVCCLASASRIMTDWEIH